MSLIVTKINKTIKMPNATVLVKRSIFGFNFLLVTPSTTVKKSLPPSKAGIDPGEWLDVSLLFADGATFTEFANKLAWGSFTIGLHVINFGSGGSEKLISLACVPDGSGGPTPISGVYRGFNISVGGSFLGLLWGLGDGLIGGAVFAWLYNRLLPRSSKG